MDTSRERGVTFAAVWCLSQHLAEEARSGAITPDRVLGRMGCRVLAGSPAGVTDQRRSACKAMRDASPLDGSVSMGVNRNTD